VVPKAQVFGRLIGETFSLTEGLAADMADCKVPGIEQLKKVDGYLYLYEDEITRR